MDVKPLLLPLLMLTTTSLAASLGREEKNDEANFVEEVLLYTNTWSVRVASPSEASSVAQQFGFVYEGPILWEEDGIFEFRHPDVSKSSEVPHRVMRRDVTLR